MKNKRSSLLLLLALVALAGIVLFVATSQRTVPQSTETRADLVLLPEQTNAPLQTLPPAEESRPSEAAQLTLDENGSYDSKDEVALYIHLYGKLPKNYISKSKAEKLGWTGGSLEPYAPGMSIGGGRFGNYEGLLPDAPGREYTECDIDTAGKSSRGAKRIVFSNDGLIYYTDDHYESFALLYGEGD